jgi:dTDP-4-dehydrorhamnose 3,5-epimerase
MRTLDTRLDGLILLRPDAFADERGFFLESYRRAWFTELGLDVAFVQDNHSRSARGTLRGLHFQASPGQAKLVRVARGAIRDVVVDLRRSSPTFGEHEHFALDDREHLQLFVPVGFAHGFCVVSDVADVTYKVSSYYDAAAERGIAWDDPALSIDWPMRDPIVSERDRRNPTLAEARDKLPDW